jgi:nucleoside-specific outer membrane channel protein Tsx
MTMHLAQGLNTIRNRKYKPKMTKTNIAKWQKGLIDHNRQCKRMADPKLTFEQYVDYCHGISPKKDLRADRSTFVVRKSIAQQQIEEFNKKYPSSSTITATSKGDGENAEWQKEKLKISSTYTIAPAYNKGAYQVVPKNEIKHIGK